MNTIQFISLGPGEAELITLKALKALQNADIIFCPASKSKDPANTLYSRSAQILQELEINNNKIELFHVPMSKNRDFAQQAYDSLFEQCCKLYKQNKNIAIVAEGDCSFYSSIQYVYQKFTEINIPLTKIAGVPAFIAAASFAGIHIVKQDQCLQVIANVASLKDLQDSFKHSNAFVLMKLSQSEDLIKAFISELSKEIIENKQAKFHYFENVGNINNQFYTSDKETILSRKFPYFSLLIITTEL